VSEDDDDLVEVRQLFFFGAKPIFHPVFTIYVKLWVESRIGTDIDCIAPTSLASQVDPHLPQHLLIAHPHTGIHCQHSMQTVAELVETKDTHWTVALIDFNDVSLNRVKVNRAVASQKLWPMGGFAPGADPLSIVKIDDSDEESEAEAIDDEFGAAHRELDDGGPDAGGHGAPPRPLIFDRRSGILRQGDVKKGSLAIDSHRADLVNKSYRPFFLTRSPIV